MLISVIVRTLNEETYLPGLLSSIRSQQLPDNYTVEIIVVDSGSTDKTLDIARSHQCRVTHISQEDFSFGRSLNQGCDFAQGELLVFVSGHCLPTNELWLALLVKPLTDKSCSYSYGRQIGLSPTKFSEHRVFLKYYPSTSFLPQEGFFANNANAALTKKLWHAHKFDESLTGLEDMHLAKQLVQSGYQIGYTADATVYHIHDESWLQVRNRF
ncbi:MAG: glycosyltransferase family A protein, partial [Gammaproteobacteria bacterium]|nr:glycosyltransferase family A protein [Gammaproteobacteria bacterium]